MRPPAWRLLLACLAFAAPALINPPARAADTDLNGTWKLVLLDRPFSETELILLDIKDHGGKPEAEVKDSPPLPQTLKVTRVESKGGAVTLGLALGTNELTFAGQPAKNGAISGVLKVGPQSIPARLEKTKADKVARQPVQDQEAVRAYIQSREERDPKAKVKKLRDLTAKSPGSPSLAIAYSDLVRTAAAAEMPEADLRKIAAEWVDGMNGYDGSLAANTRLKIATELSGKTSYAGLALELAKEADAALGKDAPLQSRAEVATALAAAAQAKGDLALARGAKERADKLEAQLDEEYHKNVPPFKPEVSDAGKGRKSDRVVLLELFTGAQCPPCVAADVAFDALIDTYKPTELVTLQYHLHIPGPDPLTDADSEARVKYYPDFQGTPSPFFDGKFQPGGGGGMAQAKGKYDEYRAAIDEGLKKPSGATIDLKVDRDGDAVKITATAQAKDGKKGGDDAKVGGPKLRLRLALIEEQVRYVGGNNLRFHHHVVRAMPGGVEGKALADGQGKAEVTVHLGDLRKSQEQYLSDFTKEKTVNFPKPLPPINLDKLSVVAFVQDDGDKSVLNAALTPVGDARRP